MLEQKKAEADQKAVDILKGISPVAWRHANLFGRFEFNKRGKVGLDALVKVFENLNAGSG